MEGSGRRAAIAPADEAKTLDEAGLAPVVSGKPPASRFSQRPLANRPPPPDVALPPLPPLCALDAIRQETHALAASESVDKASALRILRIFHEMENLLVEECSARDRQIVNTNFELEKLQLECPAAEAAASGAPASPPPTPVRRRRWKRG